MSSHITVRNYNGIPEGAQIKFEYVRVRLMPVVQMRPCNSAGRESIYTPRKATIMKCMLCTRTLMVVVPFFVSLQVSLTGIGFGHRDASESAVNWVSRWRLLLSALTARVWDTHVA